MTTEADDSTLAQLRAYECPEGCEFFEDDGTPMVSEHEADQMIGGDEHGFLRCVDCDAVLEQSLEGALDMLQLIAERHPEMADAISAQVGGLIGGDV